MFGLVAVASGLGALAVGLGPGRSTTYAGYSELTATLTLAAGLALVLAGIFVSLDSRTQRIGDLMQVAGFVWFAPVWVGWDGGPPLVRTIGMLATGFTFPLLVHAVLAYPDGHVRTSLGRALVVTAYAEVCALALGTALFNDPFFDPNCWANCTDNVFLVQSLPGLARALESADRWFTLLVAVSFAALCCLRLVRGSGPVRRTLLPVDVPAVLLATATAGHSVARTLSPLDEPSDPLALLLFIVGCVAVMLVSAGLAWGALRPRLQRREVARLVSSLGKAPFVGSLESVLGRAVGDPRLRIAYWLPESGRYVDADGQPVPEPAGSPGREVTVLVRGNHRVALVSHAAGLSGLESAFGPAVRLALENERLHADGMAQLDELRVSRTRIVEAGDAERQRLERDLHDGAQQRLLAASYELRLARSTAQAEGDTETFALLTEVLDGTLDTLEELRQLAHGIYPAILAEAGLAAALASLADTAPLRLRTEQVVEQRYPPATETAAYLLVVEAVEDAAGRGATVVTVSAVQEDEELVVDVGDDGRKRSSAMVRQADRIGAIGGSLHVDSAALRAVIPCA